MEYVCAKIKEIDPKSTPLGYDSAANWFITMTEQLGSPYTSAKEGEKFQFLNDTNIDFVTKFRQWYLNGWVTTQDLYGSYTSGLFVNIPTETNPVCSYMSIGSSAGSIINFPLKNTLYISKINTNIITIILINFKHFIFLNFFSTITSFLFNSSLTKPLLIYL